VVVYDRLVNPQLLRYAPPGAELIYAGKQPGGHALSQEVINALLVAKAREGKIVVRLKGGDPFVFGRGGEEAEALADQGIPFEVVPGVTAAVAVPAYAGIPVTHRRYNSSLAIVTGNQEPGKEKGAIAWDKLAGGASTLVFLMGRQNLAAICAQLHKHGRDPATPVAVIERGTTPSQRTVVGTLADIEQRASKAGIRNPAVIVVGGVVALREKLAWREKEPLFGRRIVITRALAQAGTLAQALEDLGAEVWEFPTIEIVPPTDASPLARAAAEASSYDWLIFTSANGVKAFFECLFAQGRDSRSLSGVKIAVIGEATARALRHWGLQADLIPTHYRAEGLLAALEGEEMAGKRVLLPRAEAARPILAEGLRQRGAVVDEVVAYRTVPPRSQTEAMRALLAGGGVDAITFTSSSTVRNFCALFGSDAPGLLRGVAVASIGPVTSETARELGLPVTVEAAVSTVPGLVEAIVQYFQGVRAHD
jgi:uroporphyrinogen III methyltransferase/synthase